MSKLLLRGSILAVAALGFVLSTRAIYAGDTPQNASAPNPIQWQKGPMVARLGNNAEIAVPKDFLFADGDGTRKFMELNQNPTDGHEVGLITPKSDKENWFVEFEFEEVGYVKDDDRSSLDADALLKSIQDGTEEANEERKTKGWTPFHITGWYTRPFYDPVTNNLTWAVNGAEDKGVNPAVNYSVRILGRHGTMKVDLVLDPKDMSAVEPQFKSLMNGFRFKQGNRYADFTNGDKLAGYGLTALIAGGAGAVAAKTGLLAKFWKLIVAMFVAIWKFLLVAFAAIATRIKQLWAKITSVFSRKRDRDPSSGAAGSDGELIAAGRDADESKHVAD
jgi:uncharacterized membrane-anchored protein